MPEYTPLDLQFASFVARMAGTRDQALFDAAALTSRAVGEGHQGYQNGGNLARGHQSLPPWAQKIFMPAFLMADVMEWFLIPVHGN